MAVRIPIYRQQTQTPMGRVAGGQLTTDPGPSIAGPLADVARGIGAFMQRREQEKEAIGTSWATERLASLRSQYARKRTEAIQNAGPGGSGVVEFMNSWIDGETETLLSNAPTDASREFLKNRLLDFKGQVDLNAYEYEQTANLEYRLSNYDSAIRNNAAAAAEMPGSSMVIIAETVAAIDADPTLTFEKKAELKQRTIESVSVGAVIGDIERDPARSVKFLRALFGVDHEAPPEQFALQYESATAALEELERTEGIKVHPEDRQAAVAALMREGGDISFKDGRLVVNDQQDDSDVPPEYAALPLDKRVSLLSQAETAMAKLQNQSDDALRTARILFKDDIDNRITALRNGESAEIPSYQQAVEMLGEGEAILTIERMQVLQGLAPEFAKMDRMTNAELLGMEADRPTGTDKRNIRDLAYEERVARIKAIRAAREADPGGYVVQNNGTVQAALANVSAATDAASQDPSPENMAALSAAQSTFVSTTMEAQRSLGIETPKLPDVYVKQLQTQFTQGMASNNPQAAAMSLNGLAQMLIDLPEAVGQLAEATGVLGQFAIDGVDGFTLKKLQAAMGVKKSELAEMLPAGTTMGQVEDAVTAEFAPLLASFLAQGETEASSRYIRAAQMLTATMVAEGKISPKAAARKVYESMVLPNNYIEKTYRIPTSIMQNGVVQPLDRDSVVAGLGEYLNQLGPGQLRFDGVQGMDNAEAFKRHKRTVIESARWVNNRMGDGVFLTWAGGIVEGADGMPIEVKFVDVIGLADVAKQRRDAERNKSVTESMLFYP